MGIFRSTLAHLRFRLWWNHLLTPVFTVLYLIFLIEDLPLLEGLIHIAVFIPVLIGTAGLGYLSNDLCDAKEDLLLGKRNIVVSLSKLHLVILSVLLFSGTIIPWMYLGWQPLAFILLLFQFLTYILYAFRPFRFKERGMLGILCDSFYGHLNPILVTIATFIPGFLSSENIYILGPLVLLGSLKGIRNIILHQVYDRKNDAKTGTSTFALKFGPFPSIHLINRLILPLEFIAVGFLVYQASLYIPFFYIGFIVFLLFTWLKFDGPRFGLLSKRLFKFKFLYFMNDFYEEWLPLIVLVFLAIHRPEYAVLLVIHTVLFSNFLKKLYPDIKDIGKNLRALVQ